MKKIELIYLACFILLLCLGCQLPKQGNQKPLVFTAMGCGPYNQESKDALRHYIQLENKGDSQFIAYLGDLFPGSYAKTMIDHEDKGEREYREISEILSQGNFKPTFVLPGDNETIDRKDPELGFEFWHKYFDYFYKKFNPSFEVKHQEGRVENFCFVTQNIVVIGVHKVGSQRDLEGAYWDETLGDAQQWIKQNLSEHSDTRAALILAQAGFKGESYRKSLFKSIKTYKKPTLYIHADGHRWFEKRYDQVKNLVHIQLDLIHSKNVKEGPFYPPVQFTLSGDKSNPFSYDRRLNTYPWQKINKN